MMKKVITNQDLQEKIKEAITLLCGTVKTTLGPEGSNVIIDHSAFLPFITNDGATIARNISSEDEIVDTILQLAKESSINTDNKVGDGTTTTLVLLESLYNSSLELINKGINPIILKKELDKILPEIVEEIEKNSHLPSNKEQLYMATISANDKKIGENIYNTFHKVKVKDAIKITETSLNQTEIIYKKGYVIESIVASPYFFQNSGEIVLQGANVMIVGSVINCLEDIADIIDEILITKKELFILAEDYNEYFVNEVISLNKEEKVKIILLKIPSYGKERLNILNDLAKITKAKIIDNISKYTRTSIGYADNIIVNKDETIFSFVLDKELEKMVKEIKNNLQTKDEYEMNQDLKRLAMLENGLAEIKIGAPSTTECREICMRYNDALCAISHAAKGVLPGSGVILFKIADSLPENMFYRVYKEALREPFKTIMANAGLNYIEMIDEIKRNQYTKIYNINLAKYEDIAQTTVLDSKEVVVNSLINAVSTATMLLTTTSLVVNEYQNNLDKVSNFQEL